MDSELLSRLEALANRNNKRSNVALTGAQLLSSHNLPGGKSKVWIITEADRSVTTILLPDDYWPASMPYAVHRGGRADLFFLRCGRPSTNSRSDANIFIGPVIGHFLPLTFGRRLIFS